MEQDKKTQFVQLLFWFSCFIVLSLVLIYINRSAITSTLYETGDHAANSLLILKAKSFNLWVGNYSRIGFNHPGPAILYVLAAGEFFFYDLTHFAGSPFAGQLAGAAVYNALWLTLLLCLFYRYLKNINKALFCLALFIFTISLSHHPFLTDIWFPFLYVMPYAVASVALGRIVTGKLDTLPIVAISSGFLINGHASFVATLGVTLICVLAYNYVSNRHSQGNRVLNLRMIKDNQAIIISSLLLFFIFFIPLIIETILDFPGPIASYLEYGGHNGRNHIFDIIKFIAVYWAGPIAMLIGLLTSAQLMISKFSTQETTDTIKSLTIIIFSTTFALIIYATFGIDNLNYEYIAYYYYAIPSILIITLGVSLGTRNNSKWLTFIILGLTIAMLITSFVLIQQKSFNGNKDENIIKIYQYLEQHQKKQRLVIDLDNSQDWGVVWSHAVAVEIYAKRHGKDLFCINENWHILFTKEAKCTKHELQANTHYLLSANKSKASNADFSAGVFIIKEPVEKVTQ